MRPRTLLILLAVVLGLGAFIWFYERELPSSEEREEMGKRVLSLEKEEVTGLTLESPKGTVRLERQAAAEKAEKKEEGGEGEEADPVAAEWRIVRPLQARADTFAVDQLLDSIANLEKTRTLEDVKPGAVGLDKPRATVRLKTADGEKVLKLGAEVPPGGSLVASLEGEKGTAYVVSDAILADVDRAPGEWRDRRMLQAEGDAIQRITLTGGPGGPVVLVRKQDGFWIEKPLSDRADKDMVDGLLSDLTGLTAERFVDGARPLGELGLAPPRQVVEIVAKDATPVRVALGATLTAEAAPEGQAVGELSYARMGETLFEVRTRLGESIQRAPDEWRAPQLSAFEVHDVEAFTVQDGKPAVTLTRAGTDWKRGDTTISYLPVSDLLFAAVSARADRVLSPREAQGMGIRASNPILTVQLRTQGKGTETLTLYPAVPEGIPARASGRQSVLLLPIGTLGDLQKKIKDVREAKAVGASG